MCHGVHLMAPSLWLGAAGRLLTAGAQWGPRALAGGRRGGEGGDGAGGAAGGGGASGTAGRRSRCAGPFDE